VYIYSLIPGFSGKYELPATSFKCSPAQIKLPWRSHGKFFSISPTTPNFFPHELYIKKLGGMARVNKTQRKVQDKYMMDHDPTKKKCKTYEGMVEEMKKK